MNIRPDKPKDGARLPKRICAACRSKVAVFLMAAFLACPSAQALEETNWYRKGDELLKANQYPEAIEALSTAIETVPYDYQAYCKRAAARYLNGEYAEAIADYDKALTINPNDAVALHQLALVLAYCPDPSFRDLHRALESAKTAAAIANRTGFLATLAAIQDESGAPEEAVKTQQALIALAKEKGSIKDLAAMEATLAKYRKKCGPGDTPAKTAPPQTRPNPPGPVRLDPAEERGDTDRHPFTIHVYSFRDREKALVVARSLSADSQAAFVTPISIADKGKWYRVYVGAFGLASDARKKAFDLKRQKHPYARVVRRPWAVQIVPSGESSPKDLEQMLNRAGIPFYAQEAENGTTKQLYGAFKAKQEAEDASRELRDQGFNAFATVR